MNKTRSLLILLTSGLAMSLTLSPKIRLRGSNGFCFAATPGTIPMQRFLQHSRHAFTHIVVEMEVVIGFLTVIAWYIICVANRTHSLTMSPADRIDRRCAYAWRNMAVRHQILRNSNNNSRQGLTMWEKRMPNLWPSNHQYLRQRRNASSFREEFSKCWTEIRMEKSLPSKLQQ
jgi:hypothetical protein